MTDQEPPPAAPVNEKRPKRIIRRRRRAPEEPAVDPVLLEKVLAASSLPSAYSFEIEKTVARIKSLSATHIALQMPEGLLMYATVIGDILQRLAPTLEQVDVLGDVTYGACCVDDLGAKALGAQLLVHYGHSCLVPLQHTVVPCLYVFVEIQMDTEHMVDCLTATLDVQPTKPHVYVLGTVQFRHCFPAAQSMLQDRGYSVEIPQAKPLSPGEVLGCTSPKLDCDERSVVLFVADGRFHLESTLISNPSVDVFYRYDPYGKTLTEEAYDHAKMMEIRSSSIEQARSAETFGVILGTLGRQGNPAIVQRLRQTLIDHGRRQFLILLSEITPAKLQLFGSKVDAWVQVACPRLSVDWGHYLTDKPVLTPYELMVALGDTEWRSTYPMDYYSQAGGPWSNYYESNKERQCCGDKKK